MPTTWVVQNDLGVWQVILASGTVIQVAAHSYSKEGDSYVFNLLVEGSPPTLVPLMKIPTRVVTAVRTHNSSDPRHEYRSS
jgi:hypothetical protein